MRDHRPELGELLILARGHDLFPQRGAYVAKPTTEQARDVFEMRRLIEPGILRRLIATLTPERLSRLREHHAREVGARRRDDKRAVIRLSGEFHTLLADRAGNASLAKGMRELSTLTCLIIFLYDAPTSDACREDEHAALIDAIAMRDPMKAEKLMTRPRTRPHWRRSSSSATPAPEGPASRSNQRWLTARN